MMFYDLYPDIPEIHKNNTWNIRLLFEPFFISTLWLFDIAMERSTMLLMGKSTISMAIFNSFLLVHQRVNPIKSH